MKSLLSIIVLGAASLHAGCSGCGSDQSNLDAGPTGDGGPDERTFDQCDGDAPSFVRQAFLALDGRRPRSQAEVNAYADLYKQAAAAELAAPEVVARAIMNRPEFAERWADLLMDVLHVQRLDVQSEATCWDQPARPSATPSPALAIAVRDKPALQTADGQSFTMIDLANSAIALDDLTPIYRAELFSLVSHPQPAANVPAIEAELARRADFGATFDSAYLHRDTVCLGCHTSEISITDSDDPVRDRHWPVPGAPEQAVYGQAQGISSERAHAVFRVRSFVDTGTLRPWGWASACGTFANPATLGDDIAGVDGKLAGITGKRSTVFDLEAALARGFAALRASGAPTAAIANPDAALAWLVTLKITEDVWHQATGTQLTIANYFPRNEASSALLYALAQKFVASGFSLKSLLVAIVSSDYFNRIPADQHCGPTAYSYPNVFDPWVTSESDPLRRKNSAADAVTAVDGRTLVSAAAAALEWGPPPMASRFPDYGEGCETSTCSQANNACNQFGGCCTTYQAACVMNGVAPTVEVPFQRSVGIFLRNSERGFRGLDFQARLAWEDRYGACARPRWVAQDFVDRLAGAGTSNTAATARDLIGALKDRLVGEPAISAGPEADALTAIAGSLDAPAAAVSIDKLRRICGALLGSPQFLLQGVAGRGGDVPVLTPASASYDVACADLSTLGIATPGFAVTCDGGAVTLVPARTQPAADPGPGVVREPVVRKRLADPRRVPAPTR